MQGMSAPAKQALVMVHLGRANFRIVNCRADVPSRPVQAEIRHRTEYKVALAGLPIARAAFVTQIEDDQQLPDFRRHQFRRACRSRDEDLRRRPPSPASSRDDRLQAQRYYLYYKSGKQARVPTKSVSATATSSRHHSQAGTRAGRRTGSMSSRATCAPYSIRISGLIFPGDAKLCSQTLPIFDGEIAHGPRALAEGRPEAFKTEWLQRARRPSAASGSCRGPAIARAARTSTI